MTRPLLFAIAVLTCAATLAAPEPARFGVATEIKGGALCMSGLGSLSPGSRVLLVQATDPQSSFESHVSVSPTHGCDQLADYELSPPFLALDASVQGLTPGDFLIAVAGDATPISHENGAVELQLASEKAPLRFRVCTSIEGLHLTAWAGAPLKSKRVWHQYVYLGYETDPTCSEDDYSQVVR